MTPYPVGATWEFSVSGAVGRVWLGRRHDNGREVWLWTLSIGGWEHGDWSPTKAHAVRECKLALFTRRQFSKTDVRFRRVK